MNRWRLILQTTAYYWRTNVGVVIGIMIATAVLTGALITGDSIRQTLRAQAVERIGQMDFAMVTGDRFFRDDLAERTESSLDGVSCVPVINVRGIVATPDGSRTARDVNLLGVDQQFFELAPQPFKVDPTKDGWLINDRLAAELGAEAGDELIIRMEKPSALPRESVLADSQDYSFAARSVVGKVIGATEFGNFGLTVSPVPQANIFVPLSWLQEQLELDDRANTLLVRAQDGTRVEDVDAAVQAVFTIADAQTELAALPGTSTAELHTQRIFIDPPIASLAASGEATATGILTYFVNTIAHADRETPYSMITGIGSLQGSGSGGGSAIADTVRPVDLRDDEIVINDWLADDLAASPGDTLRIAYFVLDENDQLVERERAFTVRQVVPMEGLAADRTLMPEFPGIATAESSRDWEPGMPIDLGRVRDKDEDYWQDHRGTPKAFITLAAAQDMWANRYGDLTAIRMPKAEMSAAQSRLREQLNPASLGFHVRDVRTPALAASNPATDFGLLLLGLSSFLIGASLVLTALLFVLTAQQRASQIGLQRAIGFTTRAAGRILLIEAAALAVIGCIVGGLLSVLYTAAILAALTGIWSDAVAGTSLSLHVSPVSIAIGLGASFAIAWLSMRVAIHQLMRRDALSLLRDLPSQSSSPRNRPWLSLGVVAASFVGVMVIVTTGGADGPDASRFFSAGALSLIAGIALCRVVLVLLNRGRSSAQLSIIGLGIRNNARRIGRGLAVTWMLASGVFLVGSISVHQLDAWEDAAARDSGTGGFAFVGETSIAIPADLNSQRGRDAFGLTEDDLAGMSFVSMRVRAGDEASCLNLNRPQTPRMLGVDPDKLAQRGAFTFARWDQDLASNGSWTLLDADLGNGRVPVIVDDTSAMWSLHKSIGDSIEYVDESGRPFDAVIVGTIAASILQGNVLVSEDHFRSRYPTTGGFRMFLIDAPGADRDESAPTLERALSDVGMQMQAAAERLAEFNAVQNTYLSVFQVLGGLGLLLGVAGLGVFVSRNVIERRRELALLRAVGFTARTGRRLVISEHVFLLLLGVLVGAGAAAVALLPIARDGTTDMPIGLILAILGGLMANGVLWVVLAARWALRGDLLASLQRDA